MLETKLRGRVATYLNWSHIYDTIPLDNPKGEILVKLVNRICLAEMQIGWFSACDEYAVELDMIDKIAEELGNEN
jgi:hypothetical protein